MRDIFRNRIEAGQLLAGKLMRYANQPVRASWHLIGQLQLVENRAG